MSRAYDVFLQGWNHFRTETTDDDTKAMACSSGGGADPGYGRAHAALAAAYWQIVTSGWQSAVGIEWERSYEELNDNLAKALGNPTELAYSVSAEVLARQGRHEEALAQIERALALAPNQPSTNLSKAKILNALGRANEAERAVRLAMRVDPHHGPEYLSVLGRALLHQERYAEAASSLDEAVRRQPDRNQDYVSLAVAYGYLGRAREAEAAVGAYNKISVDDGYPPLNVEEVGFWWYGNIFEYNEVYRERLRVGLRKAGVPEGAGTDIKYADFKRLVRDSAGEYSVDGAVKLAAATARSLHDRGAVLSTSVRLRHSTAGTSHPP